MTTVTDEMVELAQEQLGRECVYVGAATVRRALSAALTPHGEEAADPAPESHVVGEDWFEIEDRREQKLATIVAPDNGTPHEVLSAVLECARAWVPEARIIGNVRAGDIARAIAALPSPETNVAGWKPQRWMGPIQLERKRDDTHEEAMTMIVSAAGVCTLSYEEAALGYARARGFIRDDASTMCGPLKESDNG